MPDLSTQMALEDLNFVSQLTNKLLDRLMKYNTMPNTQMLLRQMLRDIDSAIIQLGRTQ